MVNELQNKGLGRGGFGLAVGIFLSAAGILLELGLLRLFEKKNI